MAHPSAGCRLLQCLGATLVGTGIVHSRLEVLGALKLHVHPNVVGETANEELGSLLSRYTRRVACKGLEAVGEVLYRGVEGEAAELR
jgi:hypothetical protein